MFITLQSTAKLPFAYLNSSCYLQLGRVFLLFVCFNLHFYTSFKAAVYAVSISSYKNLKSVSTSWDSFREKQMLCNPVLGYFLKITLCERREHIIYISLQRISRTILLLRLTDLLALWKVYAKLEKKKSDECV